MFPFLPHKLYTGYNGANTSFLSPRLWNRVTGSIMAADGNKRLFVKGDDFNQFTGATTAYYGSAGPYTGYIDTGCTITQSVGFDCGVAKLLQDGTDNDEVWLSPGSVTSQLGALSATAATQYLTAFECRFKTSSIVDDVVSLFMGLAPEGYAVSNTKKDDVGIMANAATLANASFIGFETIHYNGATSTAAWNGATALVPAVGQNAKMYFRYRLSGQNAITVAKVQTLVADTWYKVGFILDPAAVPAKRITIYVDNVEQSTYVTKTMMDAATFPTDIYMNPLFGCHAGAGTTSSTYIDWWACAQVL